MFEPLLALAASVLEVVVTIAEPLINFFVAIFSFDKSLSESSRLGESPLACEGRRDWMRPGVGYLVLLLVVAGGGALALWWWG